MPVHVENKDHTCTFRIEGDMTIYTAAEHKAALLDRAGDCGQVELDLSAVGEMDSAGLQILLMLKHEADAAGKELRLLNHSQAVFEVLELLNMQAHFGDPMVIPAEWTKAS